MGVTLAVFATVFCFANGQFYTDDSDYKVDLSTSTILEACRWCYAYTDSDACAVCQSEGSPPKTLLKRNGGFYRNSRSSCSCCFLSRFTNSICCGQCNGLTNGLSKRSTAPTFYHPFLRGGYPKKSTGYNPLLRGGYPDKKSTVYSPLLRGGYPDKKSPLYSPLLRGGYPDKKSTIYSPLLRGGFPDKKSNLYNPLLRGGFPDKKSDLYNPLLRGGFPKKSNMYNPLLRGGFSKKSNSLQGQGLYHPFLRGGFQTYSDEGSVL